MADDLGIEITEIKENSERKLKQRSPDTETLIDMEKGVFVKFGIPEKNGVIIVPDKPHVFIADELRVKDKSHKDELLLEHVVLIMGHGIRQDKTKWKFLNGQGVTDTLDAYNRYSKKENLPEAEFLAVCNKDEGLATEVGITVSEPDIQAMVAYALGAEISVQGVIEPDEKIRVYIQSEGDIFNLDTLQTSKEINIIEDK